MGDLLTDNCLMIVIKCNIQIIKTRCDWLNNFNNHFIVHVLLHYSEELLSWQIWCWESSGTKTKFIRDHVWKVPEGIPPRD